MGCQQRGFCSCVVLLKSPAVPLADLLPQGPSGNLSYQMPAWWLKKKQENYNREINFAWKKRRRFFLSSFCEWVLHAARMLAIKSWLARSMGFLIYFVLMNHQCENRLMSQTMLTRASSEVPKEPAETLMISGNFWSGFKLLWIKDLKFASKLMVDALGIWRFNIPTSMGWRTRILPSHPLHVSSSLEYFDEHKACWWWY